MKTNQNNPFVLRNCLAILLFLSLGVTELFGIEIQIPQSPDDFFEKESTPLKISNEEKKKTSKDPVSWGGSELTQEEKSINGVQVKAFILAGGAFIQSKSILLTASQIEIIGEDALLGKLTGQVKVEDSENGATLIASRGIYDKLADTVTLEKNPTLIHDKKDGKPVKIKCEQIVRHLEEARTVMTGRVIVTSPDFQVFGEDAVYFEKEDRIDLENKPFLFSEDRFIQGDILSYFVKEGRIELRDHANLFQVSWEKQNQSGEDRIKNRKETKEKKEEKTAASEKKERILTIFRGDKLSHTTKTESGSLTKMSGSAQLTRPTSQFTAEQISSIDGSKLVTAEGKVSFIDKENLFQVDSGYMNHNKETNYSYAKEDPIVFFLEKESYEQKGNLKSFFLERFGEKKEIVFRGNVRVETETAKVFGEFATYFEEEEKLVIEGNPILERDKTRVSSGRIFLYPKEDRAVLSDGIRVLNEDKKEK